MMMPKISVRPRSALSRPIAVSGPGCGGTNPCSTERPASAGMPTFISDRPVRWATRTTTGTSSTTPTGADATHHGPDDAVGAAGVFEQLADHRPERDEDPDRAGGRAEPRDEALDGGARRHRRHRPQ